MLHLPGQVLPDWAEACRHGVGGRGIIERLPESYYHGTRALLGKSSLSIAIEKSGVHFQDWLEHGERKPDDSEAKLQGRAFHALTLEPDTFHDSFAILPDFGPMNSTKNRTARDEWIREYARSKTVLLDKWMPMIEGMARSVRKHKDAAKLLKNCRPEVTALWVDPHTGLAMKSRADFLSEFDGVYADLKSCLDASRDGFRRTAREFSYYIQDPLYSRAFQENNVDVDNFVFIAVEKEPPYAVAIYQMSDKARLAGEKAYTAAMMRISRWVEDGHFPGLNDDKLTELDVPDFTLTNAEAQYEAEAAYYEEAA